MKHIQSIIYISLVFTSLIACNSSGSKNTSDQRSSQSNLSDDEKEFVDKAAAGGLMEVELGKVAQENCSNNRVRDFGAMMVKQHGQANAELKALAASKNITLPTALKDKHGKHLEKLKNKKGVEFDKDYMELMVKDHKQDVEEFEEASKELKDPDLKAFAAKMLPILKIHQDSAKAINKQTEVTLPPANVSDGMERQSYP